MKLLQTPVVLFVMLALYAVVADDSILMDGPGVARMGAVLRSATCPTCRSGATLPPPPALRLVSTRVWHGVVINDTNGPARILGDMESYTLRCGNCTTVFRVMEESKDALKRHQMIGKPPVPASGPPLPKAP